MTVSTTSTVITYAGNGSTTVFTFPFIGVIAADLIVTVTTSAGVSTVLGSTEYSVLINSVPVGGLWGIGGSVTYPLLGSALASGTISIARAVPYIQTVSISNQGSFYPQTIEQALDKLELQIQQLVTDYTYTLKTPTSDVTSPNTLPSAALRADGVLGFDATGQPIITTISSGTPSPGTFATPRRVSTTGTSTISVFTSDSFAGVSLYQSTAPVTTVQLPVGYGPFPIFDGSGNSGTYPIKVLPPVGKTINGMAQYYLAFDYQSAVFYNDGLNILVT